MKRKVRLSFFSPLLFLLFTVFSIPSASALSLKTTALNVNAAFLNTFNVAGDPTADNARMKNGYGVGPGGALAIEWNYRFYNFQWAVSGEAYISLHGCAVPNDVCASGSTPMMFSAFTMLRYFFLTDDFRPYAEFGLGYWQSVMFVKTNITEFGPALGGGFEYFVSDEISIGLRVRYGLQLFVGDKGLVPFHQLMGIFTFSAYI